MPSFITLYSGALYFEVSTSNTKYKNYYYSITLTGSLTENSITYSATTTFTLILYGQNTGAPEFSTTLSDQSVTAGKVVSYTLPSISDPDDDGYSISSVTIGTASSFVKYSSGKFTIAPSSTATSATYVITVTLKDTNTNPLSQSYTFNVIVTGLTTNTSSTTSNSTTNSTSDTSSVSSDYESSLEGSTSSSSSSYDPNAKKVKNKVNIVATPSPSFTAKI